MTDQQSVRMEGVRLIFRNFAGKEGPFNQEGARNFGVVIPEDVAEAMLNDGWNVKRLNITEEESEAGVEVGTPWLPVKVGYGKGRPPKIVLVTERGMNPLHEDTIEQLDWADITNVDLMVRPYHYTVQGRTGISAYVQTMYVTIEEDELERKYAEMEERRNNQEVN